MSIFTSKIKKSVKNEKNDEYWTNTVSDKFNVSKMKRHLEQFDLWCLGQHHMKEMYTEVIEDYIHDLLLILDKKTPYHLLDFKKTCDRKKYLVDDELFNAHVMTGLPCFFTDFPDKLCEKKSFWNRNK